MPAWGNHEVFMKGETLKLGLRVRGLSSGGYLNDTAGPQLPSAKIARWESTRYVWKITCEAVCQEWGGESWKRTGGKLLAGKLQQFLETLFFFFFSWRLITLQYCSGFCHTLT